MRKIEQQMMQAIHERRDWRSDNTQVVCTVFSHGDLNIDRVHVQLHGSTIAIITDVCVDVCDYGWQTPTTKSRLNAILHELCGTGTGIYQKNKRWYAHAEGEQDWEIKPNSRHLFYRGE